MSFRSDSPDKKLSPLKSKNGKWFCSTENLEKKGKGEKKLFPKILQKFLRKNVRR